MRQAQLAARAGDLGDVAVGRREGVERLVGVQPRGLGATHSSARPGRRLPAGGRRLVEGLRKAVNPSTATTRGRTRHQRDEPPAPARSSSRVSSSARAVATVTMLVMPTPPAQLVGAWSGSPRRRRRPHGDPGACSAGQKRLPGRAKWALAAAVHSPG